MVGWLVGWFVSWFYIPYLVIPYRSQFKNYRLQLYTVQKCIFIKYLNTSLYQTELFDPLMEPMRI